jgi:hypothetical protein
MIPIRYIRNFIWSCALFVVLWGVWSLVCGAWHGEVFIGALQLFLLGSVFWFIDWLWKVCGTGDDYAEIAKGIWRRMSHRMNKLRRRI